MTVLVIAELNGTTLNWDATAKTVNAVRALGSIDLLVIGQGCNEAADQGASLAGVGRVIVIDDAVFAHGIAETTAAQIAALAKAYSHVAFASTAFGKTLAPRVAGLLDVMVLADVSAVIDAETFERPIYAGNAIQRVASEDPIKVLTLRIASFEAAQSGVTAPIEAQAASVAVERSAVWISDDVAASDRPELASAKRVVSGGRGVGSKENFALIEGLADKIGAAVGASRAAVDSGFASNDQQVGQTGKVVAPDLYMAVGISGAIQHLAGMKDARVIVAINKDEEAPIFQIADYGVVGDLFALVPDLTQRL